MQKGQRIMLAVVALLIAGAAIISSNSSGLKGSIQSSGPTNLTAGLGVVCDRSRPAGETAQCYDLRVAWQCGTETRRAARLNQYLQTCPPLKIESNPTWRTAFYNGQSNANLGSFRLSTSTFDGVSINSFTIGTCPNNTFGTNTTNLFGDGYITNVKLVRGGSASWSGQQLGSTAAAPRSGFTTSINGFSIPKNSGDYVWVLGTVAQSITNLPTNGVYCMTLQANGSGTTSAISIQSNIGNGQGNFTISN